MGFWVLVLVIFDILLLFGFILIWGKIIRSKEDDPRLSRGLQMLSSKLAILEDLSQRTDTQVEQVTTLIDRKIQQVSEAIELCEKQMVHIQKAQQKSSDIAQIFQDKIPHQEIIERQTTLKYVQAAKMIQEGKTIDEVQMSIGLSFGEIELIANMDVDYLKNIENQVSQWKRTHVDFLPTAQEALKVETTVAPVTRTKKNSEEKMKELSDKFSRMPDLQPQQKNVKYFQFPKI
ncbi:MAG: hypothetical protein ACK5WZ_12020 [Pseudobdellovibrionaceae bacterium]